MENIVTVQGNSHSLALFSALSMLSLDILIGFSKKKIKRKSKFFENSFHMVYLLILKIIHFKSFS